MRPRANTISHVDATALHNVAATNAVAARQGVSSGQFGHSRHGSLIGLPMHDYQFGGMSQAMGQRGVNHGLPKLDTDGFNSVDFSGGLRTAPVIGGFNNEFDFEGLLFGPGSTINPNALHYNDSPQSMAIDAASPFHQVFSDMTTSQTLDENFEWMSGFEQQMNFGNENAIENSSPSAMSSASPGGISEVMVDGSNNPISSAAMWQQSMMAPPLMTPNFSLDISGSGGFPDLFNGGPMSPHTLPPKNANDPYFSTPPPSMSSLSPSMMHGLNPQGLQQAMNFGGPETPSSINGSLPNSPLNTITEGTRQSLVMALSQCTTFGGRKYSFPAVSSPLSPHSNARPNSMNETSRNLPSTIDLQRYIGAYVRYFHPHLPFLHIPTLSFDVPVQQGRSSPSGMIGGRGCLILSMAAIGALYELEQTVSRELFDSAKKMIQLYLEERRKADVRKADMRKAGVPDHTQSTSEGSVNTPVWLVQAMLLNVVYGHNCGDKIAGDIASTHCAALVSLARAAQLLRPANVPGQDVQMTDDDNHAEGWNIKHDGADEQSEWIKWKTAEERKRTLYGVFILSSLLVSAYNHTPALTNSEILLDLPCDEDFWSADSAASFQAKGGLIMANHNRMTFHDALGELLRTSERQHQQISPQQPFRNLGLHDLPQSDLRPSTFGCLVLINALHNYIWETRQRHHNKVWTNEETEKMHRHIEPALKAWQAAWASNPQHSLERPNPFGLGPLSADSIPLLDLAYVRLFVNLSRSKEKFWQRDYDGMADELSRGSQIIQHAEHSPRSNQETSSSSEGSLANGFDDSSHNNFGTPELTGPKGSNSTAQISGNGSTSKREKHLRKAAFYAADSLSMSDKLGVTFADFTSRELPLQSAMCAFDCAQVLAEWIGTIQERVGKYLGVLGRDQIDYSNVPAIMLFEEEDIKLLGKCEEVLRSAGVKMSWEMGGGNLSSLAGGNQLLQGMEECGYGSKILRVTAYMLDKAAVWPGKILNAPL